jgi:hypothetical protein
MLQRSVFKKRRLLRKSEINRLLQEQDIMSFKYLKKEVMTGRVLQLKNVSNPVKGDTLRVVHVPFRIEESMRNQLFESIYDGTQEDDDILIGVTNESHFDVLSLLYPKAIIIQFENVDPQLVEVEFCKLLCQLKRLSEYKYIFMKDLRYSKVPECVIDGLRKTCDNYSNHVFFPVEYVKKNGIRVRWSDVNDDKNKMHVLRYPVRNAPMSGCFFTTSKLFTSTTFEKYTFAIGSSVFYSFLAQYQCAMIPEFYIDLDNNST